MKKIFSYLLLAAMLISMVPAINLSVFAEDVITVSNYSELFEASKNSTASIKLANDITVDTDAWKGLGQALGFSGTLDGNGKTLTIKGTQGLAKKLGDATIRNLILDLEITPAENASVTAGLADRVSGDTLIENVVIKGSVTGFYASAFIGIVETTGKITIKNCTNEATVEAFSNGNENGCAGFVGYLCSDKEGNLIFDCKNRGNINTPGSLVSGIVGRVQNGKGTLEIVNCVNSGKICCYGSNQSAGILGYNDYTTSVINCLNAGFVVGTNVGCGGICGRVKAFEYKLIVSGCVNIGEADASSQYSGVIGQVINGKNYEFTNNYTVGDMDTCNLEDKEKDAAQALDLKFSAALRTDNVKEDAVNATVRFKVEWNTAKTAAAGVQFKDFGAGYYRNNEFTELKDIKVSDVVSEGDTSYAYVIVRNLGEDFMMHDVYVTVKAVKGSESYTQSSRISLAALGAGLTKLYTDDSTKTVDTQAKAVLEAWGQNRKTVCMIGDSITDGVASSLGGHYSWFLDYDRDVTYPGRLRELLGTAYDLVNCGLSGKTMDNSFGNAYTAQSEYTEALASNADIVFIMLGTNDADTNNCTVSGNEFIAKYKMTYFASAEAIVNSMLKSNPNAEFIIANCPESYRTTESALYTGVSQTRCTNTQINLTIVREWQKELVDVLNSKNIKTRFFDMQKVTGAFSINLDPYTYKFSEVLKYFATDLLHPNDRGYEMMAAAVYSELFALK